MVRAALSCTHPAMLYENMLTSPLHLGCRSELKLYCAGAAPGSKAPKAEPKPFELGEPEPTPAEAASGRAPAPTPGAAAAPSGGENTASPPIFSAVCSITASGSRMQDLHLNQAQRRLPGRSHTADGAPANRGRIRNAQLCKFASPHDGPTATATEQAWLTD